MRDQPGLKGMPVAVTPSSNTNGTSEICSCSYEARKYGVKAQMLVRDAKKLCNDLIIIPCHYDKYEKVSKTIYKIFNKVII